MMSAMIVNQSEGYLLCVATGLLSGAAAGVLSNVMKLLRCPEAVIWVCDVAFGVVLSAVIIMVTYICSGGSLRIYIFLGFFSGFFATFGTINWGASKIVNHILCHRRNDSENVKADGEKVR